MSTRTQQRLVRSAPLLVVVILSMFVAVLHEQQAEEQAQTEHQNTVDVLLIGLGRGETAPPARAIVRTVDEALQAINEVSK